MLGFRWTRRKNGEVLIQRDGRVCATLRGSVAADFLAELAAGSDAQQLMARLTGNYERGNEQLAARHPRNRGQRDSHR